MCARPRSLSRARILLVAGLAAGVVTGVDGQVPGTPEARSVQRLQAHLAELRGESLEESIRRLGDGEGYGTYPPTDVKSPDNDLEILLANRRVLKVLDGLASLSRERLPASCQAMLRHAFERRRKTFETIIAYYERPGSEGNARSMQHDKWGLSSALYLGSMYCDAERVLGTVDETLRLEMRIAERIRGGGQAFPPALLPALETMGFIQKRTLLNVYLNLLPSDEARRKRNLPSAEVVLPQWDQAERLTGTWYAGAGMALVETRGASRQNLYTWPQRDKHDPARQAARLGAIRSLIE